jgi:ATPase subunit of ABC transporter with duplicated ATPase domains
VNWKPEFAEMDGYTARSRADCCWAWYCRAAARSDDRGVAEAGKLRVLLARALLQSEVLLLDQPTADINTIRWLESIPDPAQQHHDYRSTVTSKQRVHAHG